jgi:hypothetical protein
MTWLESICLTMRQNADDVACIEALLVISHQKLVLVSGAKWLTKCFWLLVLAFCTNGRIDDVELHANLV